jgi:hypothetical protein
VTCSENGSITSQLLTNMLSKMDGYCLFDRSNGTNPFLLCDGHGSRFEEPFLEYNLESNMPWTCCIGVPYGTSVWQLGDSVEQSIMGHSRLRVRRQRQRQPGEKFVPAYLQRSSAVTSPGL